MIDLDRRDHWQKVYGEKAEHQVSWFQENPAVSLELIRLAGATRNTAIIDIGGGASRLVDALIVDHYGDVTVLDISDAAIAMAKARLGRQAAEVSWIVADVTQWIPARSYEIWHDRAAFHFLTDSADQHAYVARMTQALALGGHAIIGTFAMDGPERCSGLPVIRYDAARLSGSLGRSFTLIEARRQDHRTPTGATQRFQFSLFKRV